MISRANSYFSLPPDGWREATISHPDDSQKTRLNRDADLPRISDEMNVSGINDPGESGGDPGRISDEMNVSGINDPREISGDLGRISNEMGISSRQHRSPDDQRRSSQDQPIYDLNNSNQEFKPLKSSDPRKERKRETAKFS